MSETTKGQVAVVEHDTTSEPPSCWCKPDICVPCDECGEPPNPKCWHCGGRGLIQVAGDPATYDGPHSFVVIHHEPETAKPLALSLRPARAALTRTPEAAT